MRRLALLLAALTALAAAATAQAADDVTGGKWSSAYITEADGTSLHAAILRPTNLGPTDKSPVIMTVSVYDNSSGEFGAAGPAEDVPYDPLGPSHGAIANYMDFLTEGRLMKEGYTYVIV